MDVWSALFWQLHMPRRHASPAMHNSHRYARQGNILSGWDRLSLLKRQQIQGLQLSAPLLTPHCLLHDLMALHATSDHVIR